VSGETVERDVMDEAHRQRQSRRGVIHDAL